MKGGRDNEQREQGKVKRNKDNKYWMVLKIASKICYFLLRRSLWRCVFVVVDAAGLWILIFAEGIVCVQHKMIKSLQFIFFFYAEQSPTIKNRRSGLQMNAMR